MERNLLKPILWQAFVRWQARIIWLKDAKRTGNTWLLHCLSLHLCQGRQRGGKAHLGNFWKRWKSQASHMFLSSFAIENPGFVQALLKKRNQCWWCEGKKSWCSTMQTVLPLDFFTDGLRFATTLVFLRFSFALTTFNPVQAQLRFFNACEFTKALLQSSICTKHFRKHQRDMEKHGDLKPE